MARLGKWVFRWKDFNGDGRPLEVDTPPFETKEEVWTWAKRWLRGATEKDSRTVVKYGEVVERRP